MHKTFSKIVFFLTVIFLVSTAQSQDTFKMGFEVQVANINIVNEHNIVDLRHLRLITIRKKGQEIAHIEIDGSNRNIEFVTEPFDMGNNESIEELLQLFICFIEETLKKADKGQGKEKGRNTVTPQVPLQRKSDTFELNRS